MELSNIKWKVFGGRLYRKVTETGLIDRSAQVAFYFSFAFFPLMLVLLTLFGLILDQTDTLQKELYSYLSGILPGSAFQLVRSTMDEIIESSSGGKLTIGILATIWSASAGVDSLRSAMNAVYQDQEKWPWWKLKVQSLVLTFLFVLLLATALVIITAGVTVAEKSAGATGLAEPYSLLLIAAQWIFLFAVMLFAIAAVYSWLDRKSTRLNSSHTDISRMPSCA